MTTLLFKRTFNINGSEYLYKMEKTAPNEIQKVFGKVNKTDRNNRLDFLPKSGITHKIGFDHFTHKPTSFEKLTKNLNDFGSFDITETESVRKSSGQFPFWVTLKGNKFETAYVKTDDVKKAGASDITTAIHERIYEGQPIGYDRVYSSKDGDVLEYSYFPNWMDPRTHSLDPEQDALDENTILQKADRLIKRLKNLQSHINY